MEKIEINEKITWDTTKNSHEYPDIIKKEFFKLSSLNRNKFTRWLTELSRKYKNDINWWFKIPSSRDPNKSELYKNLIILKILKKKKISKKIDNLVLNSDGLFQSIIKNNIFKKNFKKILIKKKKKNYFFSNFKSIIFILLMFFLLKLKKKIKLNNLSNATLIDTYLDHRLYTSDIVYGDLNKFFYKLKKKKIFFLANLTQTKSIKNLIKNIFFLLDKNYFFKEQFLDFHNYVIIIFSTFFKRLKIYKIRNYDELDLSLLLKEELFSKKDFFSEFQSRVKLKFIEQISSLNINLKKAISRSENQCVDRAFNYGIRKYFPKTELLGYQGFLYYPHLENQNPIKIEDDAKVLPLKTIVTSKTLISPRKEFHKNLIILIGPSLSKQDIFKNSSIKKNNKFLLALCGVPSIDQVLIDWSTFIFRKNLNIKIIIKPHPSLPINKLNLSELLKHQDRYYISNKSIKKLLIISEYIVSSGPTSVFYESLVYGCKVLMLSLSYHDNIVSKKIKSLNSQIKYIYSKNELLYNLMLLQNKKYKFNNKNFKNIFFTKLNKKNIKLFY